MDDKEDVRERGHVLCADNKKDPLNEPHIVVVSD